VPVLERTAVPTIRQLQWLQRGTMRTMAHSKLPKDIGTALFVRLVAWFGALAASGG
jgi:hypothetical protein